MLRMCFKENAYETENRTDGRFPTLALWCGMCVHPNTAAFIALHFGTWAMRNSSELHTQEEGGSKLYNRTAVQLKRDIPRYATSLTSLTIIAALPRLRSASSSLHSPSKLNNLILSLALHAARATIF